MIAAFRYPYALLVTNFIMNKLRRDEADLRPSLGEISADWDHIGSA